MGCPKCGYERKPADTAPDWQCPACGIAYVKFRQTPEVRPSSPMIENSLAEHVRQASDPPWRNTFGGKAVSVIAFIAGFAVVRYGFHSFRAPPAPARVNPSIEQSQAENAAPALPARVVAKAQATPLESVVPVDALDDLFVRAHEHGEANAVFMVDSVGAVLSPRFSPTKPVRASVIRDSALAQTDCDRFKVRLMQGGGTTSLDDGRQRKSPISLQIDYSLNYCLGGRVPDGGHEITIERTAP